MQIQGHNHNGSYWEEWGEPFEADSCDVDEIIQAAGGGDWGLARDDEVLLFAPVDTPYENLERDGVCIPARDLD